LDFNKKLYESAVLYNPAIRISIRGEIIHRNRGTDCFCDFSKFKKYSEPGKGKRVNRKEK
jgi:hypothetical protein